MLLVFMIILKTGPVGISEIANKHFLAHSCHCHGFCATLYNSTMIGTFSLYKSSLILLNTVTESLLTTIFGSEFQIAGTEHRGKRASQKSSSWKVYGGPKCAT